LARRIYAAYRDLLNLPHIALPGDRRPRRSRGRFFNIDLINKLEADSIANWSSRRFNQFVGLKSNNSILDLRAPHSDLTPIDTPNDGNVYPMNGANLLVAALENEGVKQIFGVPGEENLDVVEALRRSIIKLVTTRHEQAAAFLAATHGRLTGEAGVCLSTLGPRRTQGPPYRLSARDGRRGVLPACGAYR
jgi:hypothetical protein